MSKNLGGYDYPVNLNEGGTNAELVASNGGLVYSTSAAFSVLAGTATARQIPMSGSSAPPSWSTATYPATTTINQILYSSSANTIAGLATANNALLITSAGGVPSLSTAIPNGVTAITQSSGDNSTKICTTAYADAIAAASAPVGATYITQTPNATLTNEQALSILSTGILKSTTATGVVSIAAANTDYIAPSGGIVTSFTFTTGSIGTAVTGVTQAALTNNTTLATTAYTDAAVSAAAITFPISLAHGGTNANLTASNGGIFYSTASAGAILAGTATALQMLQSGASGAPTWSTAAWPATTTINQLLYSSSANTVAGISTANSGILVTSVGGVPSIATVIPNGVTATTQAPLDNSTKVATTSYVNSAIVAAIPTSTAGLTNGYWKIHLELLGDVGNTTLSSTTNVDSADTVYYLPGLIGFPVTITDLGINVSATGTATACIISVYASNAAQTQPTGTPIANSTTSAITITGTGVKSATLSTPITLPSGLYFFAVLMNGICTFVSASANTIVPKFGASTPTGSKINKYTQSSTYLGGFPTAGSLSESTNPPEFIYVKGNT